MMVFFNQLQIMLCFIYIEKLRTAVLVWKAAIHFLLGVSPSDYTVPENDKDAGFQVCADELSSNVEGGCQSSHENSHIIDIKEQDSGHEDEKAIHILKITVQRMKSSPENSLIGYIKEQEKAIPKITVERMFVAINLILEIPSAVFNQLPSTYKPHYILASMLMSFTAMLICIIELVFKGGKDRVVWRWKENIPWFYSPSPNNKPFGTVIDFIGLLCAIFQCIFSAMDYAFYLQNTNNPVQISIWPLVFAICLLCSTFLKNPHEEKDILDKLERGELCNGGRCMDTFNSTKKRMEVVLELPEEGMRAHTKGALEIVLAACDKVINLDGEVVPLDEESIKHLNLTIDQFASEALRTLCLAYIDLENKFSPDDSIPVSGYTCIGIVDINDPDRPGVKESVALCRSAGITEEFRIAVLVSKAAIQSKLGVSPTGESDPADGLTVVVVAVPEGLHRG